MSNNNQYYTGGNNQYYSSGNDKYYTGGNSRYYGSGNSQYYGGNNQYYNGNQHYYQQDPLQDDEDRATSFDPLEWFFTFLHYWYLFVIALAIALGLAMLKNRRWVPAYYSEGRIVIQDAQGYNVGANNLLPLMGGFGVDPGLRNVNNQMIMLGSYDLISRVVDSIPFLEVEYMTLGRFKSRQLYRQTPIEIQYTRLDPRVYGIMYQVTFNRDGSLHISSTDETQPLELDVPGYQVPVECEMFDITIYASREYATNEGKIYFRFRDHESLVNEFMSKLELNFVTEGSTVLSIGMVSEVPQRDCEFIDKLCEIYLLRNLEEKNQVAENSIKFIKSQIANLQNDLEISESDMTDFRQRNKFVDVNSEAGRLMGLVANYEQQKMELRLRETYFDYLINYIHSNIESGAVIAPTTMGVTEPSLIALVQQLNELRIQRSELTERNVYYAKYTKDMETIKTTMEEVVKSMRASLDIEKKELDKRFQEVEAAIKQLPEKELQMIAIERNYRINDNYYTFFLQKLAEAEIQKASNTPDNTIMDKARTTSVMNADAKRKTTLTYLVIGFLIPLLLVILSELMNNKMRSPKDVVKLKLFHLIGTLRHARNQNPTLVRASPRSSYAEMLRAIRTRMEFILQRKDKMVICVTSTESGDGKTFLSTNIAALYAMTGRKVLLIDLDLRKPNIHTKLGLENGNGMSNYLVGDCEFEETLVKDTPFAFDFVRAGTIPPNPGELVHSDRWKNLIEQKREEYDYIIIDTSPIGLVPDAYATIEVSDMCLFVIRCLQTNKSFCKQTLEQMRDVVDAPEKVQLILSDIPTTGRHSYGSGGYGGYGYGHLGYGGYGGYGYGYGYGYGNSSRTKRYGRLYGKIYGKIVKDDKAYRSYYYYHHDEDDEEAKTGGKLPEEQLPDPDAIHNNPEEEQDA